MKLAAVLRHARARARYLALVLPLFALFSTVQAGCSSTVNGGYYGSSGSSGSSGQATPECSPYTYGYSDCDDVGGYGR